MRNDRALVELGFAAQARLFRGQQRIDHLLALGRDHARCAQETNAHLIAIAPNDFAARLQAVDLDDQLESIGGADRPVHTHAGEDKCYHVLAGRGLVTVGAEASDVGPGELVFCPAGEPHGVRNPGPDVLRLLVVMAPHPRVRRASS